MKLVRTATRLLRNALEPRADFQKLLERRPIHLYAGDLPDDPHYDRCVGLSLSQANRRHIRHDVTAKLPLPDDCIDIYQSEDVFEHIEPGHLPAVIDEIYRVLKPGGIFRLSVPDYRCDLLKARTWKTESGELIFDPLGGGAYENGRVVRGGHVWFPTFESVKAIVEATQFRDVRFYHYYDSAEQPVTKSVDYSIGFVMRTPDHDDRVRNPYRPMSIVLDCVK